MKSTHAKFLCLFHYRISLASGRHDFFGESAELLTNRKDILCQCICELGIKDTFKKCSAKQHPLYSVVSASCRWLIFISVDWKEIVKWAPLWLHSSTTPVPMCVWLCFYPIGSRVLCSRCVRNSHYGEISFYDFFGLDNYYFVQTSRSRS